jgi:hypothetical protein
MKVTIEKTINGYTLSGTVDDSGVNKKAVIPEEEQDEYGYHAFKDLCWFLAENCFFVHNSKHHREVLNIEVKERK